MKMIAQKNVGSENSSENLSGVKSPLGNTGFSPTSPCTSSPPSSDSDSGSGKRVSDVGSDEVVPFIHWLQGTVKSRGKVCNLLAAFIKSLTGEEFWMVDRSLFKGRTFHNVLQSTGGSIIAWNPPSEKAQYYDTWFSLCGTTCERLGIEGCKKVIWYLSELGFDTRWTRIDPKVRLGEGWKAVFTLETLKGIIDDKNSVRNWVGPDSAHYYYDVLNGSDETSLTCYFGSSSSDKMTRFYDPYFLHGCNGIDIETQLADSYASTFVYSILDLGKDATLEEIALLVSTTAIGAVSFIDRSHAPKYAYRCPVLSFWQRVIYACNGRLNIIAPKIKPTLEKSIKWIKKQVIVTLGLVMDVLPSFIDDIYQESLGRRRPEHLALLNEYLNVKAMQT